MKNKFINIAVVSKGRLKIGTENLFKSDWSQGEDIPSSIKTEYATYREKLRDLPSTVIKPSYETLSAQESICDGINDLMPTKPS